MPERSEITPVSPSTAPSLGESPMVLNPREVLRPNSFVENPGAAQGLNIAPSKLESGSTAPKSEPFPNFNPEPNKEDVEKQRRVIQKEEEDDVRRQTEQMESDGGPPRTD